jgi:hypothetical protein
MREQTRIAQVSRAEATAAIEADHGPIKRLCRATLGFKSMKTAYATIKGFEGMRMICKRQCILLEPGITGEVRSGSARESFLRLSGLRSLRLMVARPQGTRTPTTTKCNSAEPSLTA